ncbi:MAG: ATP-dependent protease ATPase subunit HslU [Treponema sp.]|nr:ATP-dependent protease ATPase subunit HslU [Treponema sp.]
MENNVVLEELTPKQIVEKLDTYIIGQKSAKKSVAIALRNRTRRLKLPEDIREEIAPKNILMIGPTGVGKTEIARRLAKLCGAPFLKVEATKYTEVGYVGRDVESMIRDLMIVGFNIVKAETQEKLKEQAQKIVEDELLELLVPGSKKDVKKDKDYSAEFGTPKMTPLFGIPGDAMTINGGIIDIPITLKKETKVKDNQEEKNIEKTQAKKEEIQKDEELTKSTREKFRVWLREGKIEDREVEIMVSSQSRGGPMIFSNFGGFDQIEDAMQDLTSALQGPKRKKKKVTIAQAREILLAEQLENLLDVDSVSEEAKRRVEQMGIIFIDEIDKIAVTESRGADVSRSGVQRDILPIVEGSTVNTKHGIVDTTHILFIAAGAFNLSKPSDLIPELQGRFPLRVELDSLNAADFKRILTEPKNALTRQYKELLATENVTINFDDDAIERMSNLAAEVNRNVENIGARRLHTIMEALLEDLSFEADEYAGETINITAKYVDEKLKDIAQNQDLSKYIL